MPIDIDILPIAPDDAPAIAALARTVWLDAYSGILSRAQIDYMLAQRYDHARLRAECGDPAKWLRQAFAGDFRAGFAACEICKGEFKLDKLYVHPEMQRRGVGAALVAHAAELARGKGYPAVILAVNKNNAQAIRAYAKYGFRVRETSLTDIGGGFSMDDYIMEKALDPQVPGVRDRI
ncbi:MAG: GNAT family N-acetyltransferase [Azoarcus sp.]|jgi:ribosomal protein S18 acetylase RimI-like enzyme|nr:GNAT family N-acetyltransferase [Azoarcus sp.]